MTEELSPMDTAAFIVQEVRTEHSKLLVVLEAVDILMGIHSKYALNSQMTIREAAQIVNEGAWGWIDDDAIDMEEVRSDLVKRKMEMDGKLLHSLMEREQLQTDALNKVLIWIESERDRIAALEENKETDLDSSLETITDILEGRN